MRGSCVTIGIADLLCCCRGHYLLALAASLRACCPLEQLQALSLPEPPSTARPAAAAEAAPGPDAQGAADGMQVDDGGSSKQQGQGPDAAVHQTPGAALHAPVVTFAAPTLGALPPSAGPRTGVHATPADALVAAAPAAGTWRLLPTPATQVWLARGCAICAFGLRFLGAALSPTPSFSQHFPTNHQQTASCHAGAAAAVGALPAASSPPGRRHC